MRNFGRLLLLILILAVMALGPRAWNYAQTQGPVPGWVTLAGQPPAGSTLDEIAEAIRAPYYTEPVWVYYGEERLLLRPEEVGFSVDAEAMLAEAEAQREGLGFWRGFVDEILHQTPRTSGHLPALRRGRNRRRRLAERRGGALRPSPHFGGGGANPGRCALHYHRCLPPWPAWPAA